MVEYCMWEPGTSNAHFGARTAVLDRARGINRAHFMSSVAAGRASVSGLLPWAGGALLAAAALVALGMRLRLAGFR